MKAYFRHLNSVRRRQIESPDFFLEIEAAKRRRQHLILIIGRKARQLGIPAPANLENLSENDLHPIRFSLSKQIALLKRAPAQKEKAA
jgi:hypothetical protein